MYKSAKSRSLLRHVQAANLTTIHLTSGDNQPIPVHSSNSRPDNNNSCSEYEDGLNCSSEKNNNLQNESR